MQRKRLHQVIHGWAGNQGLKGLRVQSQEDKQIMVPKKKKNAANRKPCTYNRAVKGYSVDIAPVSLVDQTPRLQRHWFMYQLHILNNFCKFKKRFF